MEKMLIGMQHTVDEASINRLGLLIGDLRPGDEVTITLEAGYDKEMDPIMQMLNEHGFRAKMPIEKEGKTYIEAQRMYH